MRKVLAIAVLLSFFTPATASAHQPVILTKSDTAAAKGPLLVDGTVSFAVRASFTKAKEVRAFRAQLKAGDSLEVQYLIIDKAPENKLKVNQLPTLVITSPSGVRQVMKLDERNKYFEKYSETNYLYLGRSSSAAEAGIYSFTITSKARSAVTIAVGDREVPGVVTRGALPTPTPTPAASATPTPTPTPAATPSATPSPTPSTETGITRAQVESKNSKSACWSIIDDKVYDLTRWIGSHPGGESYILFICGKDGTNSFKAQHSGQGRPVARLADYLLGPVVR
jgi:cytochrome b involved in lipid metabolism